MAKKRRNLSAPPVEWVDLIEAHAVAIRRLQMTWRRGRAAYRPLVPFATNLEVLEHQPASEWDRLELDETNLEWSLDPEDEDATEQVLDLVDDLWNLARSWTLECGGGRCDFQLAAFGEDGAVLFEDGRQCRLDPRPAPGPTPSDHLAPAEPLRVVASVMERSVDYDAYDRAVDRLDSRKDDFIGRLVADREWSARTAQQAMGAAPGLIEQAGDLLQRTIAYQHSVVEQLQERSAEQLEARKHAVSEQEKTKRRALGIGLGRHFLDTAASSLVPLAIHLSEVYTQKRASPMPEFTKAQEAMAYLLYSLSPARLCKMCKGNREAAGAALALLDDESRMRGEREALYHAEDLILLLRSEQFEESARADEQIAGRFIIGRYAMFKANDA